MGKTINLDRAYNSPIIYPIGVKESVTWINEDVETLDDTYEIYVADKDGLLLFTFKETDDELTKSANQLVWDINFEHGKIDLGNSIYELRNVTQDYREFKGPFIVTKTIKHD